MAQRLHDAETHIAQNPLILRLHRLIEAYAKSNDERDFYLERLEGFLVYVDLDKSEEDLKLLYDELEKRKDRYVAIPKLTFYEIKKVMEGFVNEKVYDIDTKEKLLDIIQSKEARENFLEFIYDHHNEMEKWQQYYQERFRIRIIEWLRNHNFDFVFEEDLDLTKSIVEKVRMSMFEPKAHKDVLQARKIMVAKAKTYYSNEALNPRPKRGRPPKQVAKVETEPQFSTDIFLAVPKPIKAFLFTPDYRSTAAVYVFSGKFTSEAELLAYRRQQLQTSANFDSQSLSQKLAALRSIAAPYAPADSEIDSYSEINGLKDVAQQVEVGREAVKKALAAKKETAGKKHDTKQKATKQTLPKQGSRRDNNVKSKGDAAKAVKGQALKGKAIVSKSAPSKASVSKPSNAKTKSAPPAKKAAPAKKQPPVIKKKVAAPKARLRPLPVKKKR